MKCKSIIKKALGQDWSFNDGEVYLDDNGEVLMDLAYQDVLFHEKGIDGSSVEVYKDIFLTSKGDHKVFFTKIECDHDVQSRINRIFPAF